MFKKILFALWLVGSFLFGWQLRSAHAGGYYEGETSHGLEGAATPNLFGASPVNGELGLAYSFGGATRAEDIAIDLIGSLPIAQTVITGDFSVLRGEARDVLTKKKESSIFEIDYYTGEKYVSPYVSVWARIESMPLDGLRRGTTSLLIAGIPLGNNTEFFAEAGIGNRRIVSIDAVKVVEREPIVYVGGKYKSKTLTFDLDYEAGEKRLIGRGKLSVLYPIQNSPLGLRLTAEQIIFDPPLPNMVKSIATQSLAVVLPF